MSLTLRTNHLPQADAKGRAKLELARIPKAGAFDVVVVGGGTGGAPAAIVAGQEGLKTAVVEPQGFLGGIGTGGGIHSYYHGLQAGVQVEIDKRTGAWSERIGGKASGFHPEAKKLALQELADEAGVRCFYRTFFVGAVLEGSALRGVVAEGESGLFWLEAKVVIDCTGDADVAAAAGAPFVFGREGDHAPQPYSLAPGHVKNESVGFRNFDAGYVDPTNALDQTRAQLLGRSHLYKDAYDETTRMLYVSPILGLRESRFIDAEYVVTLADQRAQRRFPDAIARAVAHYDNHALDYENESLDARLWIGGYSGWHFNMCHDVPYRALVTKKVENLLVACRAAGMTHDAHQLFRMQRDIQALGEAAGVAAAVSIRGGTNVRKVDVKALQKRLVERNALPAAALEGAGVGTSIERDAEIVDADLAGLFKKFGSRKESPALQELVRRGAAIHADLVRTVREGSADEKLMAAMALAVQKRAEGAEVLKETVRSRRVDPAHYNRDLPRYMAAFYLLDHLGLRETGALDLALGLLDDAPLSVHKAVAAIRALGRHAFKVEALETVRKTLRRSDLECALVLQHSMGAQGKPIADDRRFELDLAAAQVLAKFGAPDEAVALAERHSGDTRALVRNYARKVLAQVKEQVPEPALAR
ncbi:MAG: FAD-dependent oxidoreductase [Planctomycetes bacterium]|nr:FAD-dependent oxidoreductase [Planctomycetota bacterium]